MLWLVDLFEHSICLLNINVNYKKIATQPFPVNVDKPLV